MRIPISRFTYFTRERSCRSAGVVGIRLRIKILSGVKELASDLRKFLIYAPVSLGCRRRLRVVRRAASKVAERLGLGIEVNETDRVRSTYVFYLEGDRGEVPVYCDLGKDWDEEKVYDSIRSIVYALSFLPEYTGLQLVRG